MRKIRRVCVECGKPLEIFLAEDGTILSGSHYYGRVSLKYGRTAEYWCCPEHEREE